ncbi:wax ester/triacylglycerol synthase domain-containing protein [Streptomyces sp. AM 3-1-1]|uniref:wax ester/triacylglycerol synthase domain-containing protein n=1 Tax=Streptomyces sp. AM 3-1-1 TaxID=3028711 RepID=UPI0023BA3404|nr:wax ester/triacylglycerol synthase domain-containing protein [Streptomyces sp. AM 3-1-1]WEH30964.1 wax ester/triacylglycerol synthase family O-acyltransferase [Streptomyces sp. AM 3-1-1]
MPTSTTSVPALRHPAHSVDRAFLDLERSRPDVRWDSGGVAYLSGPPPTLDELRAYVGLCLPRLPLFTSRVEGGARRSRWVTDADFTVERHVHEAVAEGPDQEEHALDTALNAPFPAGARWGIWLVHGHAPDAYAICYRFQHACQDGSAAALAFRTLLSGGEPSARPVPRQRTGSGAPPRVARAAGLAARAALTAFTTRRRGPVLPYTPTGDRRLWRGRVPLDTLRRIGDARGGSAHDAHLAALAGALSAWSTRTGVPLPRVSALVPLDARRGEEEQTWGNRCFALPLRLPVRAPAPAAGGREERDVALWRLRRVTETTARLRTEPWRQAVQDVVRFMPDRPTAWYMRGIFSSRVTDILATSMPLAEEGALGGTTVTGTALLPLLLPGHLFGVGLSLFGTWGDVSFVTDRALPGAESLPGLWEEAVAELDAATTPADTA